MRLTILGAVLLLGGCSPGSDSYFPLGDSMRWQYAVQRTVRGELQNQKMIFANLPGSEAEQGTIYPRRHIDGHLDYFQHTEQGIFQVDPVSGVQTMIVAVPFQVGTRWQQDSNIQFLQVTGAFAETFNDRVREFITLDYTIEAMDDTVQVAAGTFTDCMRVRSSGTQFAGSTLKNFLGIRFIKIEQTEWYAPGVGLVKRVRNEYTTPAEWSHEYREELEQIQRI